MVLLIGLPALTYFMLKRHKVQTLIVSRVLNDFSEKTGTRITVGAVKFSFFHDLVLQDFFIEDQFADTLLFVETLRASFDTLSVLDNKLYISKIKLEHPISRIKKFDEGGFNFTFLIDSLAPKDSVSKKTWAFALKNLTMENGDLAYYGKQNYHIKETYFGLEVFNLAKDSLNLNVNHVAFKDTAGFELKDFASELVLTPNKASLTDMIIETPYSQVLVDFAEVSGDSVLQNLTAGSTGYQLEVNSARVASTDIRRFYRDFANISEKLYFSGKVYGTLGDLRGNNLLLSAGDAFDLLFDFNISGLPRLSGSFIHTDFKRLYITPDVVIPEIEAITGKPVPLKNEIAKFGRLLYAGTLTGFPGDFVAYGELNSGLGVIETDIALKDNKQFGKIEISGNVGSVGFNLGDLLNNPDIGLASLNVEVEADKPYDDYLSMFLNGEVSSLEYQGYTYTNVFLRGVFGNKHFNGGININDPNVSMLFTGRIDFSDIDPIFDFEADIRKIAPYKLNLTNKFPNGIINTKIKTKLKGRELNTIEGFVGFYDLLYQNANGEVSFDNATFFFNKDLNGSSIEVNSKWLNGQIKGQYNFLGLKNSFAELIEPFLPTLSGAIGKTVDDHSNLFTYNFKISSFDNLAEVLELPFSVSSNGELSGMMDDVDKKLNMHLKLDDSRFRKFILSSLDLNLERFENESLNMTLGVEHLKMNNKSLENIHYNLSSKGDSLENHLTWHNNDGSAYVGDIKAGMLFEGTEGGMVRTMLNLRPSYMVVNDSLWNVEPSSLVIDTTGVQFNRVFVNNYDRYLEAQGKLSKLQEDSLRLNVNGFELEYLSQFLSLKKLYLKGTLTGESVINAGLGTPVIESDFMVSDFVLNNVYTGDIDFSSSWDRVNRKMDIVGENVLQDQTLKLAGAYYPNLDSLAIGGKLEKMPVLFIQPYLENIMQNLGGLASGDLLIAGNVKDIKLLGKLFVEDGSFNVGYLNTKYFLDDSVYFTQDAIEFREITVFDEKGNKGIFNGTLKHQTFKNMEFDMFLEFKNMLALNTRLRDNDLYYGTVYATGVLAITGKGSNVHLDINAKTEDNTEIFLPLTSSEVASENNFVRFVTVRDEIKANTDKNTDQRDESSFSLNMEIETSPGARVELIFDSRIGDVIKGQGQGTLVLSYDSKADFKIFGDYEVTSGEYLFTAQNVINKKFDIQPGGVIKWSGDPYNADINLDAFYRTKAPLYDLLPGTVDDLNKNLRVPVNCHMVLKNKLMNPTINFDIVLPTADQETQQSVKNVLNSEVEVQRQVIYLLMFNRFYTPDYLRSAHTSYASANNQSQAAFVTGSEFLSNQLSNWLSQISDDFDLGVNYRPADELSSQEVEVMLSTQMFDDRLSINGNLGYREEVTSDYNFVGDFDVEYRLTPKGNFKLKAYSHSNDNIIYQNSPTTQGVGFVYKEEFDTFGELVNRYRQLIKGKKNGADQ